MAERSMSVIHFTFENAAQILVGGIDLLHLFSGENNPGKAMQKRGYTTKNFDIRNDNSQNCVQLLGLLYAGILVAGIVPGGALLAGPDCSSWVWMSRGSS